MTESDRNRTGDDVVTTGESEVVEQRLYDPTSGPDLTTVIVEAVAAAEGVDATDIKEPLLYDVVDVAAVKDALFGTGPSDARGMSGGSLTFEYRGFQITVRGDGWVQVAKPRER